MRSEFIVGEAKAIVVGPLRHRNDVPGISLGIEDSNLELGSGWERTEYYFGPDGVGGVVEVPLQAIPFIAGLTVLEQNDPRLREMAESYDTTATGRSPRQASSVRIPEGQISQDLSLGKGLRRFQLEKATQANTDLVHVQRLQAELARLTRPRVETTQVADDGIKWGECITPPIGYLK